MVCVANYFSDSARNYPAVTKLQVGSLSLWLLGIVLSMALALLTAILIELKVKRDTVIWL